MRKGISIAPAVLSFLESNRSDSFQFMSADSEQVMTTRDETNCSRPGNEGWDDWDEKSHVLMPSLCVEHLQAA
jgi:hypothetical protein